MDFPGYRLLFDVLLWVMFLAFLPKNYLIKGTAFDVFNQTPSKEIYLPDYSFYHNLSQLNQCIYELVSQFPDILDAEMRFRSRWGLSQYVVHLGNFSESMKLISSTKKVRILLSFGEHSSEYLPVQSMLYLLKNLTSGIHEPLGSVGYNFTRFVLENIDLYLIGVLNPDGRSVIEKTSNYCWKNTGSGADLNLHREGSTSSVPRQVLVEPECRVLTELTSLIEFDVFISFHSGEEKILLPLRDFDGVPKNPLYPDNMEIVSLAHHLSSSTLNGLQHIHINQSLNHYGESIFSYTSTTREIPFVYLISLWKNTHTLQDDQSNCFARSNPPSNKLKGVLKSIHPLYSSLFKYIVKWKKAKVRRITEKKKVKTRHPLANSYGIKFIVVIIIIILLMTRINLPLRWRIFYRRQRRIVSLRSLSSVFAFFIF